MINALKCNPLLVVGRICIDDIEIGCWSERAAILISRRSLADRIVDFSHQAAVVAGQR